MSVYKFRIAYEDDENIFRDIEILPNQTMRDMDEAIADAFNLPAGRICHLYYSNDSWQKIKGIDIHPKAVKKGKDISIPMVLQYVDSPHQKFLYTFEGNKQEFNLLIELVSILSAEEIGKRYPAVAKSVGPSPVKKNELLKHLSKSALKEEDEFGIDKSENDDLEGMGEEGEEREVAGEEDMDNEAADSFENEFGFDESGDFKEE